MVGTVAGNARVAEDARVVEDARVAKKCLGARGVEG